MHILDPGADKTTRRRNEFSFPTRLCAATLVGASALFLVACGSHQQIATVEPSVREDTAAIEASKSSRTPLGMVVTWTRAIVARLPHPETTKWERMLANADGSVVCLEFKSQNESRDYSHQRVAFVDGVASNGPAIWERNCTQGLYNMASAEYLIALR